MCTKCFYEASIVNHKYLMYKHCLELLWTSECEIRFRESRIASCFWKTANRYYHFSRKLQINFGTLCIKGLNISSSKLLYFLGALLYCTYELYISKRKNIKTKLITRSKAKSFFSNNVNVEGSPKNII